MSEKELLSQHYQSFMIGQLEFTSVPISTIEEKMGDTFCKDHIVLQSVEIQTEKEPIPILIQEIDKQDEDIQTSHDQNTSETEETNQLFIQKLQGPEKQISRVDQCEAPTVPKTLDELKQHHEDTSKHIFPEKDISSDNIMMQLILTISKFPDDYKQSLLNYLHAVQEKYEDLSESQQKLAEMKH